MKPVTDTFDSRPFSLRSITADTALAAATEVVAFSVPYKAGEKYTFFYRLPMTFSAPFPNGIQAYLTNIPAGLTGRISTCSLQQGVAPEVTTTTNLAQGGAIISFINAGQGLYDISLYVEGGSADGNIDLTLRCQAGNSATLLKGAYAGIAQNY